MSDEEVITVSSSIEENSHLHDEEDSASEDLSDADDSAGRSENLSELWNVISGVDAPGTFACGAELTTILPGNF